MSNQHHRAPIGQRCYFTKVFKPSHTAIAVGTAAANGGTNAAAPPAPLATTSNTRVRTLTAGSEPWTGTRSGSMVIVSLSLPDWGCTRPPVASGGRFRWPTTASTHHKPTESPNSNTSRRSLVRYLSHANGVSGGREASLKKRGMSMPARITPKKAPPSPPTSASMATWIDQLERAGTFTHS